MAKRGVSLLFCKTPIVLSCQSVWMSGLYRFDCYCETDVTIDSSLTCVFRNLKQAVRFIWRARASSLMSTLQIFLRVSYRGISTLTLNHWLVTRLCQLN